MHIVVGRIMINHRVLGGTSWQDKFIIVLFHHIFSYHLADCRGGMWGGMRREMGCPPQIIWWLMSCFSHTCFTSKNHSWSVFPGKHTAAGLCTQRKYSSDSGGPWFTYNFHQFSGLRKHEYPAKFRHCHKLCLAEVQVTVLQSQTTIGTVELRKLQNRRLGLLSAAKCAKTLWCGAGPKIPKTRPRKIRKGPIWCTKMERSPHSLGLFGWENLEKFIGPLTKMISPPTRQVLGL